MVVYLHILGTFLMRFVPETVAHRVVGWGTRPALLFARGYVARAASNMCQVLGPHATPAEIRRMTVSAFANYARYMVDLVRLPNLDPHRIYDHLEINGWEHVERAYEEGRGVVFVTGHIGSWDMAGAAFVAKGKPVSVLVETLKPPAWNARVQHIREKAGMKAIPIETGVREMLATLRRREGLAILMDRPVERNGVQITFFGRRTQVPGGAATLALRTGAPLVPTAFVRNPRGRGYIAYIGEPIRSAASESYAPTVEQLTQQAMAWLESMIRRYPDQWYMFRRMWPESTEGGDRTLVGAD